MKIEPQTLCEVQLFLGDQLEDKLRCVVYFIILLRAIHIFHAEGWLIGCAGIQIEILLLIAQDLLQTECLDCSRIVIAYRSQCDDISGHIIEEIGLIG